MRKPFAYIRDRLATKPAHRSRKGFTLVEAMVAIAILSLAVTGPMVIAQKGISSALYARDQIIAFYLAQEAIEYVRNVRDLNKISDNPAWLDGLSACMQSAGTEACYIDATKTDISTAVQSCPGGVCPKLLIDPINYLYGYTPGWTDTMFTRTIRIDDRAEPSREASVSVTISWTTSLFDPLKEFTVKEYLFNF